MAVLLIHIEMKVATAPYITRMRAPLVPTNRHDSAENAMRRSTPWTNIASASMNEPMNRKMIGSANGASAARAGTTPKTTASIGPRTAVTAMGKASLTHRTTTISMMAAMRCPCTVRPAIGNHSVPSNTTGARNRPTVRRRRLNSSSAGE